MSGNGSNNLRGNKKTIAHLLPWATIGGIEVATMRLITATADRFRHIAFCISSASELKDACERAGATVVSYDPPEPSVRRAARFFGQSREVAKKLRSFDVDLVHFSETKAAYHNSFAAVLAGVPMITHVRSQYSEIPFRERISYFPVKGYVFVSEDSRRKFGMKVTSGKTRVLYDAVSVGEPMNGAETKSLREELGVPPGATLVGMIARVTPVKDYETLAAAAAQVLAKRPETRFIVVGDNAIVDLNRNHYAFVLGRLKELGIADKFIFTGFRSDVENIVSALDIFVLCTHREGFPLSLLEAMAMGKPVVATNVGGIPEAITEGVTGYLHAHGDSKQLADTILRLIEDPALAARVGQAARKYCNEAHSVDVFADEVTRIYNEFA